MPPSWLQQKVSRQAAVKQRAPRRCRGHQYAFVCQGLLTSLRLLIARFSRPSLQTPSSSKEKLSLSRHLADPRALSHAAKTGSHGCMHIHELAVTFVHICDGVSRLPLIDLLLTSVMVLWQIKQLYHIH